MAALALLALTGALSLAGRAQEGSGKVEPLEPVDPYTKGARAALDEAGYVSLGPFALAQGIRSEDVEETIGTRILWVETEHFRIGSTLQSCKVGADPRERRKLDAELARLAKRLERTQPRGSSLDPWLRLHLYAQRMEEQYADFLSSFGFTDADFGPAGKDSPTGAVGAGRYLGLETKFTALLAEKRSAVDRFRKRFLPEMKSEIFRATLPGGLLLAVSAEAASEGGSSPDASLHGIVVEMLAQNFLDGFRDGSCTAPTWLKEGYAHACSRRVDERFATSSVARSSRPDDENAWRWERRVRGLVENRFAPSFEAMLSWRSPEEMKAQDHLVAWSRVSWMLSRKGSDRRALLLAITRPIGTAPEGPEASLERQQRALEAGFGKTPGELEEEWRKHVLRNYPGS